jgi:integrase
MATIKLVRAGAYAARIRTKNFPTVCKTFHSLRDAQAWCKRVESDQQAGRWKAPDANDGLTLGKALEKYAKAVTVLKKGAAHEGYVIGAIRREKLAAKALTAITGADIASLRDQWLKAGLAPATVRQRMANISHCFNIAAQEWSITVINPVALVRKPTVSNARERCLQDGELDAVLAASDYPDLDKVARLAAETAMRLGEIVGLRWADVSLASRTVTLADTKSGKPRVVPLGPTALALLAAMPRRIDGQVFGAASTSFTKTWAYAVKKARAVYVEDCAAKVVPVDSRYLVDLHMHDLRHTAITRLFELDKLNVMEIASISGHKTLAMLGRYTHVQASKIADKLASASA